MNRNGPGGAAFRRIGLMPASRFEAAHRIARTIDVGKRQHPTWPFCRGAARQLARRWLAARVMYRSENVKATIGVGVGGAGAALAGAAWHRASNVRAARGEPLASGPGHGAGAIEMGAVHAAEQGTSHGATGKAGSHVLSVADAKALRGGQGRSKIEQID